MKGVLQKDHIPVNKYQLLILGMPAITFTEISGIEEELQTTDLPDRTTASGGHTMPVEFTAQMPLWHTIERIALEAWFVECQDPVSPLYKKEATLVLQSISGQSITTYSLLGLYISKRALPDLSMENEGEGAFAEWTFKADQLLPI
jgi:hypothetical protein